MLDAGFSITSVDMDESGRPMAQFARFSTSKPVKLSEDSYTTDSRVVHAHSR